MACSSSVRIIFSFALFSCAHRRGVWLCLGRRSNENVTSDDNYVAPRSQRTPPPGGGSLRPELGIGSSAWVLRSGLVGPTYKLRQLDARVDTELGERIAQIGFHRMRGKVQLLRDRAVRRALRNQVDDLELGVGEAVPARFCPRLADNATFHTEAAQRAAHPARIGKRLVADVGVEGGIQLTHRRVRVVGACPF